MGNARFFIPVCLALMLLASPGCMNDQKTANPGIASPAIDSLSYWNELLNENPGNPDALQGRAKLHQQSGALKLALIDLDNLIKDHPSPVALMDKAAILSKMGRLHESTEAYAKALAFSPDKSMLLNARAMEFSSSGEAQAALELLDSALAINPKFTTAWYNKGSLLFQTGQIEQAEFHFQKALQLERGHGEALAGLGAIFWYVKGDKEGAKWYYDQATVGSLGQSAGWLGLANLDMDAGRVEQAIFHYKRSLDLDPYQADTWANLGLAQFQKKEYRDAEESYSRAIRLNNRHPQALAMRGIIRCETGNKELGCADLQDAVSAGMASAQVELDKRCP